MEDHEKRLIRLETRFQGLERAVRDQDRELKAALDEINKVSTDLKVTATELRHALTAAIKSAAAPIEKFSFGWRVLAGFGGVIVASVMFIGGVLGILNHFK